MGLSLKSVLPPVKNQKSDSFDNWIGPNWEKHYRSNDAWLDHKRSDDGAESLWRIHDKLYDLAEWTKLHPGGSEWIEETKGTDITEAFEVHHISSIARKMIGKYYVCEARSERNSPFTFIKNDFYFTLRRRVEEMNIKSGPNFNTRLILYTYTTCLLMSTVLCARLQSYTWGMLASLFLSATTVNAHNFIHMRNSWQMYLFKLSGLSVREWRLSHVLSHHMFPNSKQDLEVAIFEPILQWLPQDNGWLARYSSYTYWPIVYGGIFHFQLIARHVFTWMLLRRSEMFSGLDGWPELMCLVLPSLVYLNTFSLSQTMFWWNFILFLGSFFFIFVGVTSGHHHPEAFHDGDTVSSKKMDWGLYQMSTVREIDAIRGNLPLILCMFGEHTLHHLFPTIDHANLPSLDKVLRDTCDDFNVKFKTSSIQDSILGQFKQLSRISKLSIYDHLI